MIACGLDFGTSNSAVGVARDGFVVEQRLCVREIPRSGTPEQLVDHYGISARHIVAAVRGGR